MICWQWYNDDDNDYLIVVLNNVWLDMEGTMTWSFFKMKISLQNWRKLKRKLRWFDTVPIDEEQRNVKKEAKWRKVSSQWKKHVKLREPFTLWVVVIVVVVAVQLISVADKITLARAVILRLPLILNFDCFAHLCSSHICTPFPSHKSLQHLTLTPVSDFLDVCYSLSTESSYTSQVQYFIHQTKHKTSTNKEHKKKLIQVIWNFVIGKVGARVIFFWAARGEEVKR